MHLLAAVLHIYKHSLFVGQLYQKQRIETTKQELTHRKQLVLQQLYAAKDPAVIKQFATQKLGMKPVALTQIKKIESS